jgi:WD40 repeat protein
MALREIRRMFARLMTALFVLVMAAAARAEAPPDQRPYLRIEPGMHTAAIKRIAVSADGRLLATGSDDKTARLWSLPDGRLLRTFRPPIGGGFGGSVFAVALSPDGRLLAAGGWDASWSDQSKPVVMYVYLFDTVSGALLRRLGPLPNSINDLAFSPDGAWLAAGLYWQNGVWVWRGPDFSGAALADPKADFGDNIYGIDFDRTGRFMAVASYDGNIRLYRMPEDGELQIHLLKKEKTPDGKRPFGLAFSPDGGRLAVGYLDSNKVSVLDAATLTAVPGLKVDTRFVNNGSLSTVAWSADGATLYAAGAYIEESGAVPAFAWGDGGRERPRSLGGPRDTIMDLVTLPGGGLVWGAHGPNFGVFDGQGTSTLMRGSSAADMRGKRSGHFWSARDGMSVWFGINQWSEDPWLFDLPSLGFAATPERPRDFIEAATGELKIEDWINTEKPRLDGKVLQLSAYEISRSLAIAPDGKSFSIGADWGIYRFDTTGRVLWSVPVPGAAWGLNHSADGALLIAALGDGTIRWYRAADGAELLAFFAHAPDKRWVAWTPTGYYAASPGGEDLIGWHVNGKTWDDPADFFPASRFRERFYRPDIVKLVLETRDEARAVAEANSKARRQAETESLSKNLPAVIEIVADPRGIETAEPMVELAYRLRSPSGRTVDRVEVQVDGRPVAGRGMKAVDDYPLTEDLTLEVPVPRRDSTVSLIAWIGDQASEASTVEVKWTGEAPSPAAGRLYAVMVGVSDYDDKSLRLTFADDDARALDLMLKAQEGKVFASVETRLLVDADATEDAIEEALAWLAESAGPEDYALVFMAGHGMTDGQKFYFLPVGAKPGRLTSTAISGAVLRELLGSVKGKVAFLIDACRSQSAIDGGLGLAVTGFVNDMASAENGVVMFSATTNTELAIERADWGHGAFTKALLAGLEGEADYEKDNRIFTDELNLWLKSEVKRLTGGSQTPAMVVPKAVKDFAVAQVGP